MSKEEGAGDCDGGSSSPFDCDDVSSFPFHYGGGSSSRLDCGGGRSSPLSVRRPQSPAGTASSSGRGSASWKRRKKHINEFISLSQERMDLMRMLRRDLLSSMSSNSKNLLSDDAVVPSVRTCIVALKEIEGLPHDTFFKAANLFKDPKNRALFMALSEQDKLDWIFHHTA